MINIVKNQGQKIIELGCGANPHPQADCKVDARHIPGVTDFTADFNQPLPIASGEWDVILSIFAIEHISYRNVPLFLSECLRILKPGGTAIIVLPNTAAQLDWIRSNPTGWDNKNLFESASEKLFGSQNMPDDQGVDHNTHKAYFSPAIAMELFTTAGFIDVRIQPYGTRATDMCVSAVKPVDDPNPDKNPPTFAPGSMSMPDIPPTQFRQKERSCTTVNQPEATQQNPPIPSSAELTATASLPPAEPQDPPANASVGGFSTAIASPAVLNKLKQGSETVPTPYNPERMFNRNYFDGGNGGWGGYAGEGYRDFPVHNVIARNVLERKPESVLELGCARGYVLKRLQDAGIPAYGIDASEHCTLTRVCNHIRWGNAEDEDEYDREADLCFSIGFLDHIPPNLLPQVVRNMASVCKRGLHGVNPDPMTEGDRTRLSAGKSLVWWKQLFATHAPGWPCEIVLKSELETAKSPDWAKEWMEGDGRLKLNVGCVTPETYIHTLHGYKQITDVKVGDLVLTHRGRYRRVLAVSERPHTGEIHRISVLGMGSIRITSEHPVMVTPDMVTRRGTVRTANAEPKQWVDAKDVRRGHFTFYPHESERLSIVRQGTFLFDSPSAASRFPSGRRGHCMPINIDRSLCRLLGYYIAEGYSGHNNVSFTFNKNESEYISDVRDLGKSLFGATAYERERKNDGYEIVFSHKKMSALMAEMGGRYAEGKELHRTIMNLPANLQRSVIIGAVRGDGSLTKRGNFVYGTVSKKLAGQMKFLLYRQGIPARVQPGIPPGRQSILFGRTITLKHQAYGVRPQHSVDSVALCQDIYPESCTKVKNQPPTRVMDDGIYGYVRDVETQDYNGMVWNLEVEEDNTYVTEIGVVHNSYATMFYKGWVNIDQHDLDAWAAGQGYQYRRHDLRNGIPYPTGCVDLIFAHHFLEHLSYKEGAAFLRECRRVLRPTGALRIVVPNLQELVTMYYLAGDGTTTLETFDEMNAGCAEQKTDAGKLWSLLCPDHKAGYDSETLEQMLEESGFSATPTGFRYTAHEPIQQILKECTEMEYGPPGRGTSLFMDAVPAVG